MTQIVETSCTRCGSQFSYEKKRGRPRTLCDECKENHAPRMYESLADFHVKLSEQDREKLALIMENVGVSRIEAIRSSIRVYHALLISQRR